MAGLSNCTPFKTEESSSLMVSVLPSQSEKEAALKQKVMTCANNLLIIGQEACLKAEYKKASLAFSAVVLLDPSNADARKLQNDTIVIIEKIKKAILLFGITIKEVSDVVTKLHADSLAYLKSQKFSDASQTLSEAKTLLDRNVIIEKIIISCQNSIECDKKFETYLEKTTSEALNTENP